MNKFSEKEQFFNRNIDKTAFDSLHSHSKFSSLGGSHSIDKKRRKLKNAILLKRKDQKQHLLVRRVIKMFQQLFLLQMRLLWKTIDLQI